MGQEGDDECKCISIKGMKGAGRDKNEVLLRLLNMVVALGEITDHHVNLLSLSFLVDVRSDFVLFFITAYSLFTAEGPSHSLGHQYLTI